MADSRYNHDIWTREEAGEYVIVLTRESARLSQAHRERIVSELQSEMPGYGISRYYQLQPEIFAQYDYLTLALEAATDKVVGLEAARYYSVDGQDVLYMWTAHVSTARRGSKIASFLAKSLLTAAFQDRGYLPTLAGKTSNPLVYTVFIEKLRKIPGTVVYPDLCRRRQEDSLTAFATRIAAVIAPGLTYDQEACVIRGAQAAIGQSFYPEPFPQSPSSEVNAYFAEHLSRADQLLMYACVDFKSLTPLEFYNRRK